MKSNVVKRLLTAALTATLVLVPTIGVLASSGGSSDPATESVSESTGGTVTSLAEVPATSSVNVGGANVKTSTNGVYLATALRGTAIQTSSQAISESFGLGSNEKAYAKFSNATAAKSPLAAASLAGCAQSLGAAAGPMFNFELGKMSAGKYSRLADGTTLTLTVGIPANFLVNGATYAVVCVQAGGVTTVLPNTSTTSGVVTFNTTAATGTYMLVRLA